MSIGSIVVLGGIVFAFAAFAVTSDVGRFLFAPRQAVAPCSRRARPRLAFSIDGRRSEAARCAA